MSFGRCTSAPRRAREGTQHGSFLDPGFSKSPEAAWRNGKCRNTLICWPQLCSSSRTPLVCRQALLIPEVLSCSDFRVHAVEPRKCTVSAGSYGAEASTAPAALMDCWTFMCTVCNVCRSDGGDQLVKVNRVKQTNKSVRLTEVVRALPVPTILHAPHVTAPLRDVWSARPGDGKDRMLHDEAFRSFSSMYVLGLCNRRRCLGVCWGRESSRELKVLASSEPTLYTTHGIR